MNFSLFSDNSENLLFIISHGHSRNPFKENCRIKNVVSMKNKSKDLRDSGGTSKMQFFKIIQIFGWHHEGQVILIFKSINFIFLIKNNFMDWKFKLNQSARTISGDLVNDLLGKIAVPINVIFFFALNKSRGFDLSVKKWAPHQISTLRNSKKFGLKTN